MRREEDKNSSFYKSKDLNPKTTVPQPELDSMTGQLKWKESIKRRFIYIRNFSYLDQVIWEPSVTSQWPFRFTYCQTLQLSKTGSKEPIPSFYLNLFVLLATCKCLSGGKGIEYDLEHYFIFLILIWKLLRTTCDYCCKISFLCLRIFFCSV